MQSMPSSVKQENIISLRLAVQSQTDLAVLSTFQAKNLNVPVIAVTHRDDLEKRRVP
jgi:hypothetical protein